MIEIILSILIGLLCGIITGLTPGIHVNLVAAIALSAGLKSEFAPFLVSLAVTHSFLDCIPGILLGAPDSAMALGVLPGHRYLLKGWGYMAIKLTVIGSFFGLLLAITLIPLWLVLLHTYTFFTAIMGYLLLGVSLYMIFLDQKKWWALTVYLLSGTLGWVIFNRPVVHEPLFPLFSGLFGISTLLYGLTQRSRIPTQLISKNIKLKISPTLRALGAGNFSGFLTSMLPGLGSAQAAILGMKLSGKIGDHGFLVLIGSINTVNFTLSLLAWLQIDKARNGAIVALSKISTPSYQLIIILLVVALISGSIATLLTIFFGRLCIRTINFLPYKILLLSIIIMIISLVSWITGWRGLLLLLVSTAIGIIPAIVKCGRAHAMGCLMLPVALFFL